MAGIAAAPAEGRWDIAVWDGGPDGTPMGVWDGDANSSGLTLQRPGGAFRAQRPGLASLTPRAGQASVNRRPGSPVGGGRV
jgi:hypothetical protein